MPAKQQSTLCCLTLLAMAKLKKDTPCYQAKNDWIRIHDVIVFIADNYGVIYAENSRETFRKQAMHPFRTAALIEDNGKATNSPNYRYRITGEFLRVIQDMNESEGCVGEENVSLSLFLSKHDSLSNLYASKKKMLKMPVKITTMTLRLVQASITNYRKLSLKSLLQDLPQVLNACMLVTPYRRIW